MVRASVVACGAAVLLAFGCAPTGGPFRLGPHDLMPPVVVAEAERYVDGRCVGLSLVDGRGEEILLTIVSNAGAPEDGCAYRPIKVPCGAVLVGTLHAATGTGELLPEDGAWRQPLTHVLRTHMKKLPRGERDSVGASLIEEAIALLERGCEPTHSYVAFGDTRLLKPIEVDEAVEYLDGGTYGFRLVDAKGEEFLLSIDRRSRWDVTEERATEQSAIPYGALLLGVMHPSQGEGTPVPPGGVDEGVLGALLRSWHERDGVGVSPPEVTEQGQMRQRIVREAIEFLWSKCEPSN